MPRSLALLCNVDSGRGEAGEVEDALRRHGADVSCYTLDEVDEAAACGCERLVVAGGDGSIAPAAQAAGRAGVPLAVIATGTANDFARAHELPRELERACELAVEGTRLEPLEIGWMDGRPFVNVASIGLSPAAAREATGLKKRLGPLAYVVGALRAGMTSDPIECSLVCDGETVFEGEAWQVTIACSGAFGGGSSVEADPSDGRLDAVAIRAGSRLGLARRAFGMRTGRIGVQRGVDTHRARRVELRVEPGTEFNVDGEVIDDVDASFEVRDDFFRLVVPG